VVRESKMKKLIVIIFSLLLSNNSFANPNDGDFQVRFVDPKHIAIYGKSNKDVEYCSISFLNDTKTIIKTVTHKFSVIKDKPFSEVVNIPDLMTLAVLIKTVYFNYCKK
jgi:hypothetical protein